MSKQNQENPFSDDNLKRLLNSSNKALKGSAEYFLNVCKYPEDYWVMPDYYYPGLDSIRARIENQLAEMPDSPQLGRIPFVKYTANDSVLMNESLVKDFFSDRIFHGLKNLEGYCANPKNIDTVIFNDDETITFKDISGQEVVIPWGIFCGVFLKARELGFSRPDSLNHAGPDGTKAKEKWLANQEKIKELQSKIDE